MECVTCVIFEWRLCSRLPDMYVADCQNSWYPSNMIGEWQICVFMLSLKWGLVFVYGSLRL